MTRKRVVQIAKMAVVLGLILATTSCGLILGAIIPSEFGFSGSMAEISNVYLFNNGAVGSGYDLRLVFTGSGLSVDADGFYVGSGDYLAIDVISDESDLSMDTYTYVAGGTSTGDMSFAEIGEILDGAFDGPYYNATSGGIDVRRPLIGSTTTIVLNIDTPNGTIEGQFRGEIQTRQ